MEPTTITVKGAREHNLRDVNLTIPRGKLVCFTGVSGSGKSSLAFDTLFAEGQRRYMESLSAYARQFLGQFSKPDVDHITGLSPAISIQQKTSGWNPRSTVGTITQIHDYLRVLFARVGTQHCPQCDQPISAQTREQIAARIASMAEGTKVVILAPVIRGQKGEHRDLFDDLRSQGFARARVDGAMISLDEPPSLGRHIRHDIEVVIDRIAIKQDSRARVAEAVELALKMGKGSLIVHEPDGASDQETEAPKPKSRRRAKASKTERPGDTLISSDYACAKCGISFEQPSPQLLSFNSPTGMCLTCDGLGEYIDFVPELLVPDPKKSFLKGAIEPMRDKIGRWRKRIYQGVADDVGFDLKKPWKDLSNEARDALLYGLGGKKFLVKWRTRRGSWKQWESYDGVVPDLRAKYHKALSPMVRAYYEKYMRRDVCHECRGARLNAQALAIRLCGLNLHDVTAMSIADARAFFDLMAGSEPRTSVRADDCEPSRDPQPSRDREGADSEPRASARADDQNSSTHRLLVGAVPLTDQQMLIARDALKEIRGRLRFLENVGLHYLTLNRAAPSLSGGESQRIRLASQIGAGLVGVLYILDEPSIGLHPRDNRRLLDSLLALRDMGNTVIVVEHDEETMRTADEIVDFGPGPGVHGGEVVAQGDLEAVKSAKRSITGRYLSGAEMIDVPKERRRVV